MIRFAVFLMLALALAACGSVPQPFRGTGKVTSDNPLIDVPAAMGVDVTPVAGLTPELSTRFTRDVADRLLDLEIPAEPVMKAGGLGFVLAGRAGASVASPGGERFDVVWTLKSQRGTTVGQFNQSVLVPPDGPVADAHMTAEQVAVAMGLTDAPGMAPDKPGSYAAKPALPSISVKPVEGAPGDGREALKLAVLQAMTDAGLHRDDINPDITLFGTFTAKPHDLSTQEVVITWRAVAKDGHELGHLDLNNVIPSGALEGNWGPTAFSIAAAAQSNLLQLIASAIPTTPKP